MKSFMQRQLSVLCLVGFSFGIVFQAQSAQWEVKDFQNLTYHIYVPDSLKNQKAALMITLHGCAQRAEDFAHFGNWETAAEKYRTLVVAPKVPNGGVNMGCWNYYGSDHSIQNKDHQSIFQLLQMLLKDRSLNIDPRRVYVSGLSSGGGEALLLGCLRPDLFAGMGLNSSPAVPTAASDISNPPITSDQMAKFCQKLAGSKSTYLASQMTSVIVADKDYTVSNEHSKIIVEAMRSISNLQIEKRFSLQELEGNNKTGEGALYMKGKNQPQISWIINNGLGHNWAAGGGKQGGAFVTRNSINYPLYVLGFFESFNPRLPHQNR
jgi:poly(3-hydroxybutyrate) depolymerase